MGARRRWQGWLGEVFADVYGALCAGLAFGQALADFAMTGPEAAAGTADYPPLGIRVRVAAEALARKESTGRRDAMIARWAADFPADRPSAHDDEAAAVVRSLLAGPYPQFGGVPLTSVVDASPWEATAGDTATALLRPSQLSPDINVRILLAAAGLAFARIPSPTGSATPRRRCSHTPGRSRPGACAPPARRSSSPSATGRRASRCCP